MNFGEVKQIIDQAKQVRCIFGDAFEIAFMAFIWFATDAVENVVKVYEDGKYFAVLAGSGANMEVTGIVVIESQDPIVDGVTARETGGFILYR